MGEAIFYGLVSLVSVWALVVVVCAFALATPERQAAAEIASEARWPASQSRPVRTYRTAAEVRALRLSMPLPERRLARFTGLRAAPDTLAHEAPTVASGVRPTAEVGPVWVKGGRDKRGRFLPGYFDCAV